MTTDAKMIKAFFQNKNVKQFQLQLIIICVLKVIYNVYLQNKLNNQNHEIRI